jgi:hypothetical protein
MFTAKQTNSLKKHKRALFICNYGFGNVLIILPILSALEQKYSSLKYFCTDHDLFHNKQLLAKAGVSHLEGFVKSIWRRFLPEDTSAILEFASSHKVTLIVNMRLEASSFDKNYLLFKEEAEHEGVTCWDLHDFGLSKEVSPISIKIQRMFSLHGAELGKINRTWLRAAYVTEDVSEDNKITVAVHTGAKQSCKRWNAKNWSRLINQTLDNIITKLLLFSGIEEQEKEYARRILQNVNDDIIRKCEFINDQTIDKVFSFLAKADLIITHDTFVAHFAAACGIPVVVFYTVTNGRIWQPVTTSAFSFVQSHEALKCSEMKVDGTCKRYYSTCEFECSSGVQLSEATTRVQEMLDIISK